MAFINEPVSMPFARVPEVQVDLVTIDWQLVAERIVNDLITQDAFQLPGPTVFEAEAKLRVPLSDFAPRVSSNVAGIDRPRSKVLVPTGPFEQGFPPRAIVRVPVDGRLKAFLEIVERFPVQLALGKT